MLAPRDRAFAERIPRAVSVLDAADPLNERVEVKVLVDRAQARAEILLPRAVDADAVYDPIRDRLRLDVGEHRVFLALQEVDGGATMYRPFALNENHSRPAIEPSQLPSARDFSV